MIHTSKSKETKKDVIARGSEGHICNMVANIGRYAAEYFEEAMEQELVIHTMITVEKSHIQTRMEAQAPHRMMVHQKQV